jgi:hypothetical protein
MLQVGTLHARVMCQETGRIPEVLSLCKNKFSSYLQSLEFCHYKSR